MSAKYVDCAAFDVSNLRFGSKPLGSDPSKPVNVAIHYGEEYRWYLKPVPAPSSVHPSTGKPGLKATDLPLNCPFGVSTEILKSGDTVPTKLEPKIDLVLRGEQLELIRCVEKIEEAAFKHMADNFEKFCPKDYADLKKRFKKEPTRDQIEASIKQNSCIKDLKKKNDDGSQVIDETGKILTVKIRKGDNPMGKATNATTLSKAHLDTFGYVMPQDKDTPLTMEDIHHQAFKGNYLSVILQPSAYWFNPTGMGVKLFLAAARVIPRRMGTTHGAAEVFCFAEVCSATDEAADEAVTEETVTHTMESLAVKDPEPAAAAGAVSESDDSVSESSDDDSEDDDE